MTQEVRLLLSFRPEANGVGEGVHCLTVASDERASEVDVLDLVLFRLQVSDLANVVTVEC